MTDQSAPPAAPQPASIASAAEDKVLPAVVYALYLIGFATGVTVLIGLILAYANQGSAGQRMATHYQFQIRTFWVGLAWALIGGALIAVGLPLSLVLIGLPIVWFGGAILALLGFWYAARCILGLVFVSRGEAYPRPRTWLI